LRYIRGESKWDRAAVRGKRSIRALNYGNCMKKTGRTVIEPAAGRAATGTAETAGTETQTE
jgi:hypothetical protein